MSLRLLQVRLLLLDNGRLFVQLVRRSGEVVRLNGDDSYTCLLVIDHTLLTFKFQWPLTTVRNLTTRRTRQFC